MQNIRLILICVTNICFTTGVVISQSAAKKLTSYKVEKTSFSVNTNDVLLNLYGDEYNYKSFPKIGDKTYEKVLIASRRRDRRTALYDFQNKKMREIDFVNDDVLYTSGGTVVDITIFNNIPLAELRKKKDEFNQEVCLVLENQYRYWNELKDVLETIIPVKHLSDAEFKEELSTFKHVVKHPLERDKNPNKYTDELAYYWKLAHENVDEQIAWRFDGKAFDNFKIQFTILKENPLTEGCKITGRLTYRMSLNSLNCGKPLRALTTNLSS